jgi:hypothetical protein
MERITTTILAALAAGRGRGGQRHGGPDAYSGMADPGAALG